MLLVHDMFLDVGNADRAERAQSNMKRHKTN